VFLVGRRRGASSVCSTRPDQRGTHLKENRKRGRQSSTIGTVFSITFVSIWFLSASQLLKVLRENSTPHATAKEQTISQKIRSLFDDYKVINEKLDSTGSASVTEFFRTSTRFGHKRKWNEGIFRLLQENFRDDSRVVQLQTGVNTLAASPAVKPTPQQEPELARKPPKHVRKIHDTARLVTGVQDAVNAVEVAVATTGDRFAALIEALRSDSQTHLAQMRAMLDLAMQRKDQ
jgi:hypothetical protein